jgi:hypothetical protein
MDETKNLTVVQRLARDHDPVAEAERREAYLARKRERCPRYVAHTERMAAGVDGHESLATDNPGVTR